MRALKAITLRLGYFIIGFLLALRFLNPPEVVEFTHTIIKTETKEVVKEVPVIKTKYIVKYKEKNICEINDDKFYQAHIKHPKKYSKNRLLVNVGAAPVGNDVSGSFNKIEVKLNYGATAGLTYVRDFSKNISGQASYLINDTAVLGLGVNW